MFSCIKHGWTSFERTCKECFPDYVRSSSGTSVMITPNSYVFDGNNKKIKELEEEIKILQTENARYREALEFCAYKFVEDPAVQICHECEFGYDKIASIAYKALKGE